MGYAKSKRPINAPSFQGSGVDFTANTIPAAALANNSVGTVQLDLGTLQVVSVALSAANIIAMNATPVSVLAAPGAGKAIVVEEIVFEVKRTSTAFTGGGAVSFQYHTTTTSVPHSGSVTAATVTTGGAGTAVVALGPNTGSNGLVIPSNEGIDITNATAAFAAGTGTATVFVRYRIITL